MSSNGPSKRAVPSTETSRSLLTLVKQNDADAWDRLVDLYSPLIYFWCQRAELPDQEIADVFQEVFHSVARNIASFRRDQPGDTFRGWLRTITRNKVHDFYRRNAREPKGVGGTDALVRFSRIPSSELRQDCISEEGDETGRTVYRQLFQRAFTRIRPHFQEKTWEALWRVVIYDRSTRDVALDLSMQPGAVRVAKSRVLQRLRQEIGDASD